MDTVIEDVYEHRADLDIIFITDLTEKMILRLLDSRDLEFHEVTSVVPCVYLRKNHPLASRESLSDIDLAGYPYLSFEHTQGVAADSSEEYQMTFTKRPDRCITVNDRATMMNIISQTDAYTTGSGLLVESFISQAVVSVPLAEKNMIRIGWIVPQGAKVSPQAETFIRLLENSVEDSIRFTKALQKSITRK